MPFQKHARITVTNEGSKEVASFYFNIDYRAYSEPLPPDLFIFTRSTGKHRRTVDGRTGGGRTATRSWKTRRM
jgi:hypothetical protein